MSDLDQDGKAAQVKPPIDPVPHTSSKTTTKPVEPPAKAKSGFNYDRGNFDTSVITLLATINMNIVSQTEILKKAIEEKHGGSGK